MKAILLGVALVLAPVADANQVVEVADVTIATGVVDRAPIGGGTSFPTTVGRLYCFTRITGAEAGTEVQHVWFHGDQEMARVTLTVGGSNWRTWSSKNIVPEWTGNWRVEVQGSDGTVLSTTTFTVQ